MKYFYCIPKLFKSYRATDYIELPFDMSNVDEVMDF